MKTYLAVLLLVSTTFGQTDASQTVTKKLYFLQDHSHHQWCGYKSESEWKSQVQALGAMIVGGMDYLNDRLSVVHVTEVDETGDWAINDEYALGKNENITTVKRTINIIPENTSEEQVFVIKDEKATRQRRTILDLRTGKRVRRSATWLQSSPPVSNVQALPFVPILGKWQEIWSLGRICVPENP